jgi:Uma2 family endonuclease
LCRENDKIRLERTKEGTVRMNPPKGGWTGDGNREIAYQLSARWRTHERGRAFNSGTGFRLPDGSTLSPEASYVSKERLRSLPKGALRGFPRICPDLIIELQSRSDPFQDLPDKMKDWISNRARLGWLIDPYDKRALVYRPKRRTSAVRVNQITGGRSGQRLCSRSRPGLKMLSRLNRSGHLCFV